jgi:hypothetical protein
MEKNHFLRISFGAGEKNLSFPLPGEKRKDSRDETMTHAPINVTSHD